MSRIKAKIVHLLPYPMVLWLKRVRGWVRAILLKVTHSKVTKEKIIEDLRKLGIREGNVLFVHSSLKSLGFVEGGADAVIDALIESVGKDGTIAMPSFTLAGSMAQTLKRGIVFNPKTSPSTVGAITEAFRKRKRVHRSIHPTHSICAFGANAKWITNGHENASTNFGQGTPLYKIMEADGIILGLGVEFGPVTFAHVLEDTITDFPIRVYCDKEYVAKVIDVNGLEREMRIKAHDSEVARTRIDKEEGRWIREFVTEYLSNQGFLRAGYVGGAKSWIIRARDLFAAQKGLLAEGITFFTTRQQYEEARMG